MPREVWGEITYPFLNFNGCTVEVLACVDGSVHLKFVSLGMSPWWSLLIAILVNWPSHGRSYEGRLQDDMWPLLSPDFQMNSIDMINDIMPGAPFTNMD